MRIPESCGLFFLSLLTFRNLSGSKPSITVWKIWICFDLKLHSADALDTFSTLLVNWLLAKKFGLTQSLLQLTRFVYVLIRSFFQLTRLSHCQLYCLTDYWQINLVWIGAFLADALNIFFQQFTFIYCLTVKYKVCFDSELVSADALDRFRNCPHIRNIERPFQTMQTKTKSAIHFVLFQKLLQLLEVFLSSWFYECVGLICIDSRYIHLFIHIYQSRISQKRQ